MRADLKQMYELQCLQMDAWLGMGVNNHVRILDTANKVILVIGEPGNGHGVDNLVVHSCRSFFSKQSLWGRGAYVHHMRWSLHDNLQFDGSIGVTTTISNDRVEHV